MGDLVGFWRFGAEARSIKEFVQLGSNMVRALHRRLTQGVADRDTLIMALWDWVAREVAYPPNDRHRLEAFGRVALANDYDFFAFPPETLTVRVGDCDDSTLLLLSLLRNSLGAQDAFGVLGDLALDGEAAGHAWAVARREDGQLYVLETTLAWVPPDMWYTEGMVADQYLPSVYFNDQDVVAVREPAFPLGRNEALRRRAVSSLWGSCK